MTDTDKLQNRFYRLYNSESNLDRTRLRWRYTRVNRPTPQTAYEVLSNGGYVYLMRASDGTHKIGASIHPHVRRAAIASEIGLEMTLIASVYSDDPLDLESDMHKRYRHLKVHRKRDWFNLTPFEIAEIVEYMQETGGEMHVDTLTPLAGSKEWNMSIEAMKQTSQTAIEYVYQALVIARMCGIDETVIRLERALGDLVTTANHSTALATAPDDD